MYRCYEKPTHLSAKIDKFDYILPYGWLVGGVFSIKPNQYKLANGYSNSYWGWGGEDDDFSTRLKAVKLEINRPDYAIARYRMMHHKLQNLNNDRHELLKKARISRPRDGLNSVKYTIVKYEIFTGFTYFLFDIGLP
jgi:hypothetical protein